MNSITEKELSGYIKEISSLLVCKRRQKNQFVKQIKTELDDFIQDNPGSSMEHIYSTFGTPEQIANCFLENRSGYVKKKISIKKCVIACVIAVVLIYAIFVIASYIDVHREAHGYFSEGLLLICEKTLMGTKV